jgi:hypothetical protein
MAFFGLKSSKKAEEEKQAAVEQARRDMVQNNYTNLSNLSKGSQVNFTIPYFDVYDPRFMDTGCPVSVHGSIVYSIDDMDLFHQINKNEAYSDETFKNKLRGQVTLFVKGVVSNAPADAQIPVVQLERKVMEISQLVQARVAPQVAQLFGITVRNISITSINIDKDSRGYSELKALTADLERERTLTQHRISISNFEQNNEMDMEMRRMQTVETARMQLDDQRERLRIERDVTEAGQMQLIEDGRRPTLGQSDIGGGMFSQQMGGGMLNQQMGGGMFGAQQQMGGGMFGGQQMGGAPQMGGTPPPMGMGTPPPMTSTLYHAFINGQQAGPFDVNTLRQYAQQGLFNAQTQVWSQGMPQWAPANTVPELAALFAPPPPIGGQTPPPIGGNGPVPPPTL